MGQSYLKNAALLTGADVLLRLAGMGLRIYLANALGGEGMGLYQLVLAVFAAALLAISLILLSNTIRLSIYSKRYLINTMKLVGATKWFIMRPFLASSVWPAAGAGAGASASSGVSLYGLSAALPELTTLAAMTKAMIIVGSMMAGGVALALLFTAVSVNRFVDMRSDKIHLY